MHRRPNLSHLISLPDEMFRWHDNLLRILRRIEIRRAWRKVTATFTALTDAMNRLKDAIAEANNPMQRLAEAIDRHNKLQKAPTEGGDQKTS